MRRPPSLPAPSPLLVVFLLCVPMAWAATAAPVVAQDAPRSKPCDTPEHRSFDFWVGEWDVFNPQGERVGRNSIRQVMNGCVLHESYDGRQGYHGESFNIYDASRGVWHQSWVDNGGLLLSLEGGIRGDAMVLEGTTVGADGAPVLNRITWTPLPGEPARVRQHWEVSTDGGASWSVLEPEDGYSGSQVDTGADMIVSGARGLSNIKARFVGSVSHKLAQLSPVTCVSVR